MASGEPGQYTPASWRMRQRQRQQHQHPPCPRARMPRSNAKLDKKHSSSKSTDSTRSNQPFPPLSPDDLGATHDVQNDHGDNEDEEQGFVSSAQGSLDVADDADFQSHYSHESQSLSEASSDSDEHDIATHHHPFRQSTSSLHGPNAFAPPFYNRPPTPLPPSPSLTSLLRPPFSATTSRPTTPDGSDVETPDDTEAAVAKSAQRATTVPRASPKVPTYEYYGFVLYLASSLAFRKLGPTPSVRCGFWTDLMHLSSDLYPLVVSSLAVSPSARYLLLPQSLVVPRVPLMACHVYHLHLYRLGILQHRILDSPDEQRRKHRGRGCQRISHRRQRPATARRFFENETWSNLLSDNGTTEAKDRVERYLERRYRRCDGRSSGRRV